MNALLTFCLHAHGGPELKACSGQGHGLVILTEVFKGHLAIAICVCLAELLGDKGVHLCLLDTILRTVNTALAV